jgi:hypothetical protein
MHNNSKLPSIDPGYAFGSRHTLNTIIDIGRCPTDPTPFSTPHQHQDHKLCIHIATSHHRDNSKRNPCSRYQDPRHLNPRGLYHTPTIPTTRCQEVKLWAIERIIGIYLPDLTLQRPSHPCLTTSHIPTACTDRAISRRRITSLA